MKVLHKRTGKLLQATLIVLVGLAIIKAEDRQEIAIPDLENYLTLKCDFHTHTVFSDGTVWPTVRIEEAWSDGLDVIAITDHIEYQTHKEYGLSDYNAPYKIAKDLAEELGIILVKGGEITRGMPLMHGNAIFLEDVEALSVPDERTAYMKANEQGAYVFWNHPGWRMPNEIPVWDKVHDEYFKIGLIQGIEIVNGTSYYPLTFQWAIEKNLTILGNSDVHGPIASEYTRNTIRHRPITLVFAKKRTHEAIKNALTDRRTAVYSGNNIYGRETFLRPLAEEILQMTDRDVKFYNKDFTRIQVINHSCLNLELERGSGECPITFSKTTIPGQSTGIIYIYGDLESMAGKKIDLPVKVNNFLTGPADTLTVALEIKLISRMKK